MRSMKNLDRIPGGMPLLADDVLEFHASRLVLLLDVCGTKDRIDGLTKLAKLDFFVRYPNFFEEACTFLKKEHVKVFDAVESSMVRYHYGPWDRRYYQILAYLESRQLLSVEKIESSYVFTLSESGKDIARKLRSKSSFDPLVTQMKQVKRVFGARSGSSIKNLIYQLFDTQVAQLELEEVIAHGLKDLDLQVGHA